MNTCATDDEAVLRNPPACESGTFRIARASRVGMDTDDALLVRAMLDSDPDAWREFKRRYDRLVRHCIAQVAQRFGGASSREDQREIYAIFILSLVAQDMHKLRAFNPELGYRLSSWIGRLAANSAYDYLRALTREPPKETLAEATDIVCEMPDPYEQAVEHEQAQIAARTLEGFSPTDQRFAALYFGEGMAPAEVARSLNISLNTVYSKRSKIQSRLGSVLESLLGSAEEKLEADGVVAA
jgi:RNA polymerase sigma-70 factor (ECF subfamily)